jgi:hypothetical protein
MPKLDIPLTKYVSPCFQFARFHILREHYGDREVRTTARFRKEREAWVAAAFLLAYGELTDRFWWLTICPEISPDIVAIAPRKEAHGWGADRMSLEILEYEDRAPVAGVGAAVERKLRDKAYPADYRLVCHVRHRPGEAFNTGEVAAQLKGLRLPLAEVWLVGSVESDQSDDYVVSRLHPEAWEYRLSYLQHCAETPQLEILDAGQGSSEAVAHGFMEIELP